MIQDVWITVWGFFTCVQGCESTDHTSLLALSDKSYTRVEEALDPVQSVPLPSFITWDTSCEHTHH